MVKSQECLLDMALSAANWSVENFYNGYTADSVGPGGLAKHCPIDPATDEMSKEQV